MKTDTNNNIKTTKKSFVVPFLKNKPRVSLISLIVFIAVFALVGAYFVYQMFASTLDLASAEIYSPTGKLLERISGPDRYSTAVGISKKQFPTITGGTVVLASGDVWADSASGAVLARKYNGPILLTQASSLNTYTKNELTRVKPTRVIILGGTNSVSTSVESGVKSLLPAASVERISGVDRYQAAANIALKVFRDNGNKINDNTAFVVTGNNFPDVLTVSSIAAAKGYPVLYTSTTLPSATKSALATMGVTRTIVVGGTASVPESVKTQLPGAIRISGNDRYIASINLAEWARINLGTDFSNIGIASAEVFSDALTAGPYLASVNGPIILSSYEIGSTTFNYLNGKKSSIQNIRTFGGSATISNSTYGKLGSLIGVTVDSNQIAIQQLLDERVKLCPILAGSTATYGDTSGYQAISYYQSGRIVISPNHTAELTRIMNHEIYHIVDWRDNGKIDWGENVPRAIPDCTP